jgi:tripartite-type tricarboxylate transporter receptor subunit TctC
MRRGMLMLGAVVTAAMMTATAAIQPAAAQAEWPERPLRIVVGFGPGGGTDIIARIVATPLSEVLGQPVVVENRPGAGGTIGADAVAKAEPDGYSLFMMNNGHAVSAVINRELPYDAVEDFDTVSMVATMPLIVVANRDFEADNVEELIDLAREDPAAVDFASVGVGSSQHFAGALLFQMADVEATHIPYEGTPAAIAAVLAGETPVLVEVLATVLGQIQACELKAIANTSREAHPAIPDVPSVSETLPEYDVATWYGLAFPAGTPHEIIDRMNEAVQEVLARDEVRQQAIEAAFQVQDSSPQELEEFLRGEIAKWEEVRERAGIPQR